jgi:hypothetical protein
MTEPIDAEPIDAEPIEGALPAPPAAPEAPAAPDVPPPWGEYAASAPVLPTGAPVVPPRAADPLRGLLAGFVAAVVGAVAWGLVVAVAHISLGIIAVFVGYGVGWAVHRFGGAATTGLAAAAAVLAALGILAGFILGGLLLVAHDRGIGVLDVVSDVVDWPGFINASVNGLGWLFLAIGAYSAFRLVAQNRRG